MALWYVKQSLLLLVWRNDCKSVLPKPAARGQPPAWLQCVPLAVLTEWFLWPWLKGSRPLAAVWRWASRPSSLAHFGSKGTSVNRSESGVSWGEFTHEASHLLQSGSGLGLSWKRTCLRSLVPVSPCLTECTSSVNLYSSAKFWVPNFKMCESHYLESTASLLRPLKVPPSPLQPVGQVGFCKKQVDPSHL